MRIGVTGSMDFINEMQTVINELKLLNHTPYTTTFFDMFIGKSPSEIKDIKEGLDEDTLKDFWKLIQGGDALLVLNYKKRDIDNYIGGSTLIEMSYAYILGQKIFLMNPIPKIQYYYDEIRLMNPIVINKDLRLIK